MGKREKECGEHVGRTGATDAGWVVLINSQRFIPVILHRGGKEDGEKAEGREREMQRREGGRVEGRLLPLLPQCTAAPC